MSCRTLQLAGQRFIQVAPIVQPGQGVMDGLLGKLRIGLLQGRFGFLLAGDIYQDSQNASDVAVLIADRSQREVAPERGAIFAAIAPFCARRLLFISADAGKRR
jgi:hypothetical protein